jgi:hypothetical protein
MNAQAGNAQVQDRLYATYRREYENFTHLPGESIDMTFQQFMVVVDNVRANVTVFPYDDHDRVMKLLHSLDHTICNKKVEAILEYEKYETLTIDELFLKLKSVEVDRGVTAHLEGLTDSHSIDLVRGSGAKSNANPSSQMYSIFLDVFAKRGVRRAWRG